MDTSGLGWLFIDEEAGPQSAYATHQHEPPNDDGRLATSSTQHPFAVPPHEDPSQTLQFFSNTEQSLSKESYEEFQIHPLPSGSQLTNYRSATRALLPPSPSTQLSYSSNDLLPDAYAPPQYPPPSDVYGQDADDATWFHFNDATPQPPLFPAPMPVSYAAPNYPPPNYGHTSTAAALSNSTNVDHHAATSSCNSPIPPQDYLPPFGAYETFDADDENKRLTTEIGLSAPGPTQTQLANEWQDENTPMEGPSASTSRNASGRRQENRKSRQVNPMTRRPKAKKAASSSTSTTATTMTQTLLSAVNDPYPSHWTPPDDLRRRPTTAASVTCQLPANSARYGRLDAQKQEITAHVLGSPCGAVLRSAQEVKDHLKGVHNLSEHKNVAPNSKCAWAGCNYARIVSEGSYWRHVMGTHMLVKYACPVGTCTCRKSRSYDLKTHVGEHHGGQNLEDFDRYEYDVFSLLSV